MPDFSETTWISSKEVLARTNISRATLNNYIKMGILPKPEIMKTGSNRGTGQLGYFPEMVIQRIEQVNLLKSEGYAMSEIAKKFQEPARPVEVPSSRAADAPVFPHRTNLEVVEHSETIEDEALKLTIEKIRSPAYLVNYDFEIEWINQEAEEQIFNHPIRTISHLQARNLFKLFFAWEFNERVKNWTEIVGLHLKVVKSFSPRSRVKTLFEGISTREIEFLEQGYDTAIPFPHKSINTTQVKLIQTVDSAQYYKIHTLFFREGIFFLYVPTDKDTQEVADLLATRGKLINELLKRQLPSLVSLCVLVADIQDSVKISSELLPSEYFSLINELWKALANTFDKYDAICGKHAGDGMLHYFIKKPGSNYVINAINCALELKEKTKQFNNEMKIRKGWFNDIYLNIGINEGQEYFGTVRSTSNIEFTALGDSINYAGRLSDFARFGSVWTTKNVIIKLTEQEMESVRFGIYRQENDRRVFVANSFMRVIDLLKLENREDRKFTDISTLPITEIVKVTTNTSQEFEKRN